MSLIISQSVLSYLSYNTNNKINNSQLFVSESFSLRLFKLFILMIFIFSFLSIFVILSSINVSASKISGTIYNTDLSIAKNVLVSINTSPEQRLLSKDGTYSFSVPIGYYKITAVFLDTSSINIDDVIQKVISSDYINVKNDGDFIFDLFLIPDISLTNLNDSINISDSDFNILNELNKNNSNLYKSSNEANVDDDLSGILTRFFLVILIIVFFVFAWFIVKKRTLINVVDSEDDIINEVIAIIKRSGGRISQKELRKLLPIGEAKVSLIISELVARDKIKKIKKGRANIIILKK